jgi:hypothetical protein
MKIMTTKVLSLVLIGCLMIAACEGPQGPDGAAGPKGANGATGATGSPGATGPAGANGATGPTGTTGAKGDKGDPGANGTNGTNGANGEKGDKGDPGTANVIYSGWFTPNSNDWQKLSDINYTYTITEGKITQDIVDRGVVLAYSRQNANSASYLLPLTMTTPSSISNYNVGMSIEKVIFNFLELLEPSGKPANNLQFRYVIIPGGIQTRANLDYTNFEAVARAFGIPE